MTTLTITDSVLDLEASVEESHVGTDGKTVFKYRLTVDDGKTTVEGNDLRSPRPYLGEALESLLDFLGAFCEATQYPDSDNRDLFPAALLPWAEGVSSDSLWMLRQEIQRDTEGE